MAEIITSLRTLYDATPKRRWLRRRVLRCLVENATATATATRGAERRPRRRLVLVIATSREQASAAAEAAFGPPTLAGYDIHGDVALRAVLTDRPPGYQTPPACLPDQIVWAEGWDRGRYAREIEAWVDYAIKAKRPNVVENHGASSLPA